MVKTAKAPAGAPRELSSEGRLARGKQRCERSDYQDAELDFRSLLSSPEAAQARLGLGQVLVTTGHYTEASSVLAPLSLDPQWAADAALWTARAQQFQGNLSAAERTLRSVPAERWSRALRLELGTLLLRQGFFQPRLLPPLTAIPGTPRRY